jgi:uncharacterized RDD family membrane protein YckC
VARLIDSGLLLGVLLVFALVTSPLDDDSPIKVLFGLAALAILLGYEIVMIAVHGQTVGKRMMKLRVVRTTGEPAGWGAAIVRFIVPAIANCVTCGIGGTIVFLSPLFDNSPWQRGWYDKMASTMVIRDAPDSLYPRATSPR